MTRDTTREAYEKIKGLGILSKRKQEVYDYVFYNPGCTMNEAWRGICPHLANGGITTRFSELERMGAIRSVGRAKDQNSNFSGTTWEVTGEIPEKIQKKQARGYWILLDNALWFSAGTHQVFLTEEDARIKLAENEGLELVQVKEVLKSGA